MSKAKPRPPGRKRRPLPTTSGGNLSAAAVLGRRLRELREGGGKRIADVARAAGLSLSKLYDLEAGRISRPPDVATLARLRDALDWPLLVVFCTELKWE